MTLNQVPVETAIHLHAPFEVYHITYPPVAQVGLFKGFIDGCNPMLLIGNLFYSQACSVMRQALIGFKFMGNRGRYPENPS